MSTMQNYLTSRSPCGSQTCDDKPTDGDIRHKGRVMDKMELRHIVREETDLKALVPELLFHADPHVYEGERCIFCNVNTYDDGIYGPFECIARDPLTFTTETP